MILILVFAWLICAGFAAYIATQKHRSAGNWLALGLAFGVFALFAIMAVPELKEDDEPIADLRSRRGW